MSAFSPMQVHDSLESNAENFDYFTPQTCPSLSTSFLSIDTSPMSFDDHRPRSIASSEASLPPDVFSMSSSRTTASPVTPGGGTIMDALSSDSGMRCMPSHINLHAMYSYSNDSAPTDVMWMPPAAKEASSLSSLNCHDLEALGNEGYDHHAYYSANLHFLPNTTSNLSLSRSIFNEVEGGSNFLPQESLIAWPQPVLETPPQTVTPSATFQQALTSSPHHPIVSITPVTARYAASPASTPSRSSYTICSLPRSVEGHPPGGIQPRLFESSRHDGKIRRYGSRVGRRVGDRRSQKISNTKLKSSSRKGGGWLPELVIEKNGFPCEVAGCVDKNGKQKSFKRAEHRKRHEKTVHSGERPHKCWVPQCKTDPFSRMDNLKSHLEKTHGRRSAAARNSYVATLDKSSEYYDPECRGPFENKGFGFFPVVCKARL